MHEARLHEDNVFLTLTYAPESLPPGGSLRPDDFVGFMKRLRWHFGEGIRFFQCGEYGSQLSRPHHHALIFGMRFPDSRFYRASASGGKLLTSETLDGLWGHGQCTIGEANFESAAYVARYAMKKVVGPAAESHYAGRIAEYLTMSRRPGIGRGYIDVYGKEVYRSDELVVRGQLCKPPRYYDNVHERKNPSVLRRVKARRRSEAAAAEARSEVSGWTREEVKKAALTLLSRSLES